MWWSTLCCLACYSVAYGFSSFDVSRRQLIWCSSSCLIHFSHCFQTDINSRLSNSQHICKLFLRLAWTIPHNQRQFKVSFCANPILSTCAHRARLQHQPSQSRQTDRCIQQMRWQLHFESATHTQTCSNMFRPIAWCIIRNCVLFHN